MVLIPSLTTIEARWQSEIVQRPDVISIDGQHQRVLKNEIANEELYLGFDWYEHDSSESPVYRFTREFRWLKDAQEAGEILLARKAAGELLADGSVFRDVASALLELCKDAVTPSQQASPVGIGSHVPEFAPSRLKVYLPYHLPQERRVELDVIHYLDAELKQAAYKRQQVWLSRQQLASQELSETAAEELLNNATVEPHVINCIKTCAELTKGIYPTFDIDIDAWMGLTQGAIDSLIAA